MLGIPAIQLILHCLVALVVKVCHLLDPVKHLLRVLSVCGLVVKNDNPVVVGLHPIRFRWL